MKNMFPNVTKSQLKLIKSLQRKKNRTKEQCFLVEGTKSVIELLTSDLRIKYIVGTDKFYSDSGLNLDSKLQLLSGTSSNLSKAGTFSTNREALAVVEIPKFSVIKPGDSNILALDSIRDPGNLGTLLRIADWYGIENILLSEECADIFNPKVINSSMGSFIRLKVNYADLTEFFGSSNTKVVGAFTKGDNVHTYKFPAHCIILIGNESHGIRKELENFVDDKISIPRYGQAESLNAAVAAAVILDNFRSGGS